MVLVLSCLWYTDLESSDKKLFLILSSKSLITVSAFWEPVNPETLLSVASDIMATRIIKPEFWCYLSDHLMHCFSRPCYSFTSHRELQRLAVGGSWVGLLNTLVSPEHLVLWIRKWSRELRTVVLTQSKKQSFSLILRLRTYRIYLKFYCFKIFVNACDCMWVFAHECRFPQRPNILDLLEPELEFKWFRSFFLGSGKWVFWKSNRCS